MKISTDSWHYKLWMQFGINPWSMPRSLCPYFWGTVGLMLLVPFVYLIAGMLWLGETIGEGWHWLKNKRIDPNAPPKEPKPKVHKEPGLFRSYAKASKQKVCPILDYVDAEPWIPSQDEIERSRHA